MPRKPEIGNVQLYPNRPLRRSDKNGYVLKFYCPILCTRIRKNCGTRDRRDARRIQRECQERLLNGKYLASDGAITAQQAARRTPVSVASKGGRDDHGKTWDECYDRFRQHRACRLRESSLVHALSRLQLAERIFVGRFADEGYTGPLFVRECFTLSNLEFLQERLLAGDDCRYDRRSPNTVNSTMGAVMAFVRYCHHHEWIERVPRIEKLAADDVMKGRPLTAEEFERMLAATPLVVGQGVATSWQFTLRVLWESGFRMGDVMDFCWDDDRHLHPVWPQQDDQHPTLVIPSSQKNGEHQVIPMLPGLRDLLRSVPLSERTGWVVDPRPVEYRLKLNGDRRSLRLATRAIDRLTKERVSRVIALIGKEAKIVVRSADERTGKRVKYASAHDLRRGCALRLINAGVSAETLMVVMRHADFATTQKFYGAMRSAQAAATEILAKLSSPKQTDIVGGLMGGPDPSAKLSDAEVSKLKALLASL